MMVLIRLKSSPDLFQVKIAQLVLRNKSMNTLNRRAFLKKIFLVNGLWILWSVPRFAFSKNEISLEVITTFRNFLDVLIPEDMSPSASQVNLDAELLKHAGSVENYSKLIFLGCQWLDLQSNAIFGDKFMRLGFEQKNRVVEILSKNPVGSVPAQFFSRLRRDAFTLYYAKPRSWRGINFPGPTQPLGYPNYYLNPEYER